MSSLVACPKCRPLRGPSSESKVLVQVPCSSGGRLRPPVLLETVSADDVRVAGVVTSRFLDLSADAVAEVVLPHTAAAAFEDARVEFFFSLDQVDAKPQHEHKATAESLRHSLRKAYVLDVQDVVGVWMAGQVLELKEEKVLITYGGFSHKWNEWIRVDSARLAPLCSRSTPTPWYIRLDNAFCDPGSQLALSPLAWPVMVSCRPFELTCEGLLRLAFDKVRPLIKDTPASGKFEDHCLTLPYDIECVSTRRVRCPVCGIFRCVRCRVPLSAHPLLVHNQTGFQIVWADMERFAPPQGYTRLLLHERECLPACAGSTLAELLGSIADKRFPRCTMPLAGQPQHS